MKSNNEMERVRNLENKRIQNMEFQILWTIAALSCIALIAYIIKS